MDSRPINTNGKRLFIARHGETVFNAAARMQGMDAHTPLTLVGCNQATKMGQALRSHIADVKSLSLLASPSGRTLQTLALVASEIGADWHDHDTDHRLSEIDIGAWEGRYYTEIQSEIGEFIDYEAQLFTQVAPGGEDYEMVSARLRQWIAEQDFAQDMLIISHGLTGRVLRGLLRGDKAVDKYGAPFAPSLSQGSMVMIRDGEEQIVVSGDGSGERA